MSTNKDLKAYIRIDGSGRDVPGSLVLRTRMPGNGKWRQILADQCCNPVITPTTTTTTLAPIVQGGVDIKSSGSPSCGKPGLLNAVYMRLATPDVIAIGDTFYQDAAGTIPLAGNPLFYTYFSTPNLFGFSVQFDANGVVTNSVACP